MKTAVLLTTLIINCALLNVFIEARQLYHGESLETTSSNDSDDTTGTLPPFLQDLWSSLTGDLKSSDEEPQSTTENPLEFLASNPADKNPIEQNNVESVTSVPTEQLILSNSQSVPQEVQSRPKGFFGSFGRRPNSFGVRRTHANFRAPKKTHRVQYMKTVFRPITFAYEDNNSLEKAYPVQMWSPVSNLEVYDHAQDRSLKDETHETPDLLSGAALVSVDQRVVDLIERYPLDCSQKVLCRIGSALVDASPFQALLLYSFDSTVFGYRDEASKQAIDYALDGENCARLSKHCPDLD